MFVTYKSDSYVDTPLSAVQARARQLEFQGLTQRTGDPTDLTNLSTESDQAQQDFSNPLFYGLLLHAIID